MSRPDERERSQDAVQTSLEWHDAVIDEVRLAGGGVVEVRFAELLTHPSAGEGELTIRATGRFEGVTELHLLGEMPLDWFVSRVEFDGIAAGEDIGTLVAGVSLSEAAVKFTNSTTLSLRATRFSLLIHDPRSPT